MNPTVSNAENAHKEQADNELRQPDRDGDSPSVAECAAFSSWFAACPATLTPGQREGIGRIIGAV